MSQQNADVGAVREFNRFYTARLGLLKPRHLDGEFSLTEARIIYEVGASPGLTASLLRSRLSLDAGYISRMLSSLSKGGIIRQQTSLSDGREKLLLLTDAGKRAAARLDLQSSQQMEALLGELSVEDRASVVHALVNTHTLLRKATPEAPKIVRLSHVIEEAHRILEEYYEALQVVQRDGPRELETLISDSKSGMWLAFRGTEVVGCVILRKLSSMPGAGECKCLYVKPSARGQRIAVHLLDALEEHARAQRVKWIYLDTHDGLEAAIALYQKRGYERCDRYNSNPQATLFMRKAL